MDRRWGIGLLILGALMMAFFWLVFDISVPLNPMADRYGYRSPRVVNDGLMNDRLVGTLIALAVAGAGMAIMIATRNDPKPQPKTTLPPPQPPFGFTYNMQYAVFYRVQSLKPPSVSRPIWNRELSRFVNPAVYKSPQIEWAYASDVAPKDFALFIAFIEAYRNWQFSGGKRI
ncbi:MAG: hypothetical protein ACYC96_09800 [Fimbriimonadaceae bacterium]